MLPDLLAPGLRLVVCGTAASAKSAQVGAYYAGPGNKFWPTLAEVGLTPRRLEPAEFPLLLEYGIGLTDIAKGQAGGDADITFTRDSAALVRSKIEANAPGVLCFNGKRAGQECFGVKTLDYGLQEARVGETLLFVAPSTSGAASGAWDVSYWRDLAEVVRSL
ncbi:MAG TPA: mismatch-specific DNA-glycosylase [Coriobacteriia bacterium]|nr:mismatch-specific DNA-glycosylase [Coriobacteriia bacterium]